MGILSIARKAISFGRRALNVTPEFLIGDSSEIIGKAMRSQKGSIFKKVKAGAKALEADVIAKKATQGGFAKRVLNNLRPKFYLDQMKKGANAAKLAGKSKFLGGLKGLGKGIAKKMPFIGAALTIAFEAPNIYTAFKEGGFGAGMKEVGGAAVELGAMAAGAAIGSAICPGVGTIIGGIVGAIGGALLRGKTYSEKKAEQEAIAQLPQYKKEDIEKLYSYGFTDEEIEQLRQNGYTMEDINKAIEEELDKNPLEEPIVQPEDNTRVDNPHTREAALPSQKQIEDEQKMYQKELERLQKELNIQTPAQSYNPMLPSMPYMNYGMMNPFMFGGMAMTNPFMYGMGGYSNPFTGSLFQMTNPFMYNSQNQYFRYTG